MMAPRDRIARLRKRIRESDDVAQPDAVALLEFSEQLDLLGPTYSDLRHDKLLRHCTMMAEGCGVVSNGYRPLTKQRPAQSPADEVEFYEKTQNLRRH